MGRTTWREPKRWLAVAAMAVVVAGCGPRVSDGEGASAEQPAAPAAGTPSTSPPTTPTTTPAAPTTTAPTAPPTTAPPTTPTTAPPTSGAVISGSLAGVSQAYLPLWQSSTELNREFDRIRATGARWVRFDFYWGALEPSRGSYNWALTDRAVAAANARGLQVLAMVAYTPAWARPGGTTDHAPPTNPADYANFLRAAVARYAPQGVRSWEIWNEPNSGDFWTPRPDVAAYTRLLQAAYTAIHSVDAGATVITGGLAPSGGTLDYTSGDGFHVSPWRFLVGMYDNGARGYFDAVGHHPYPGMPYSPSTIAVWNPFQQTVELHNLMVQRGDGAKKIWGTEAGSWTGSSTNSVTEAQQAQFTTQFLSGWAQWSYVGPFFLYSLRDMGTNAYDREDNFGLLRHDYSPKPAMAAFDAGVSGS